MGKDLSKAKTTFYFCDGGSCKKAGGDTAVREGRAFLRNNGLWDETHTIKTRCNGRCEDAPTWIVQPGNYWYKNVDQDKAAKIIASHHFDNKPVLGELIYADGMEGVDSDKERPATPTPVFEAKEDPTLGKVLRARGFHSDQYLYPLFRFLNDHPGNALLRMPNGQQYKFAGLKQLDYSDPYRLSLQFDGDNTVMLVIALVPKTEDDALANSRISLCEYLIQIDTAKKYIRLSDKRGRRSCEIILQPDDNALWAYCLSVQLLGAQPTEILANG